MIVWKSYMRTAGWGIIWKKIIAIIDATFVVVKRKLEKIQVCMGFEPLTSAIPMQCSTNWANKPTGSNLLPVGLHAFEAAHECFGTAVHEQ